MKMELGHIVSLYSITFIFYTKLSLQTCIQQEHYEDSSNYILCENFTSDYQTINYLLNSYHTHIEITNSDLKEIKPYMFGSLNNCQKLKITSSNVEKIHPEAFDGLNLQYLSIQNNTITYIDKNSFNGLLNLLSLDLSYNKISYIDSDAFSSLNSLKYLSLNNNNFTRLKVGAFILSESLEVLNLANNNISIIERHTFIVLGSTERLTFTLNLSNNKIFKIETGAFNDVPNLSTLYLSNNQFENISTDPFNNLYNLQLLYLNNNQISKLQIGLFKHLNKLTTLDLSFNNISTLDLGIFVGLHNLIFLNLSHNHLITFTPGIFHNIDRIVTLDISFNNFNYIDVTNTLSHIISDRTEIYLEGNQWSCSILTQMITQNKNLIIKEGNEHNVTNIKGNYCTNEATLEIKKNLKANKNEEINQTIKLEDNLLENKKKSTDNNLNSNFEKLVKIITETEKKLLADSNGNEAILKIIGNIEKKTDQELKESKLEMKETNNKVTITNNLLIFMCILITFTVIIKIIEKCKRDLPFMQVRKEQSHNRNAQEMDLMS